MSSGLNYLHELVAEYLDKELGETDRKISIEKGSEETGTAELYFLGYVSFTVNDGSLEIQGVLMDIGEEISFIINDFHTLQFLDIAGEVYFEVSKGEKLSQRIDDEVQGIVLRDKYGEILWQLY